MMFISLRLPIAVISFLVLATTAVAQVKRDPEVCLSHQVLAKEVLKTAENHRNSGEFRLNSIAQGLLDNTYKLLKTCTEQTEYDFSVGSTLAEFLILKDENDKAKIVIDELNGFANNPGTSIANLKLLNAQYQDANGAKEKAKKFALEAVDDSIRERKPATAAKALWFLGSVYEQEGIGDKAIGFYKRAVNVDDLKGIKEDFILESLMHIGNISYQNKDYPTAFEYYKKGKSKALEYNIGRLIPFAYYHLGKYYFDIEKNKTVSIKNLERGLTHARSSSLENYFITPIILQKLGVIYFKTGEKTKAQQYFGEAIQNAERNKFTRMIPLAYKYLEEMKNQ